jgi:hypothetical protein
MQCLSLQRDITARLHVAQITVPHGIGEAIRIRGEHLSRFVHEVTVVILALPTPARTLGFCDTVEKPMLHFVLLTISLAWFDKCPGCLFDRGRRLSRMY